MRTFTIAALGSLALAPLALGAGILGNLPATNDTATTADINALRWKALSFTMPAGLPIQVGNLQVRLTDYDDAAVDAPSFQIVDHTGDNTIPGTNVLLMFNAPPPGGTTAQEYTFTPAGSFFLQPSTSYWLRATGVTGGNYDWRGSSPAITPTGIATYAGGSRFTTNSGGTWTNSTTVNSFQLNEIPEPTFLGLAPVAMLVLRRRRD